MRLKRAIKSGAGLAAVAAAPFVRQRATASGCILAYHRIAPLDFVDPALDDWNVSPAMFERHVEALLGWADIVPLGEIVDRCAGSAPATRPCVALTFDDGYANFYRHVVPVLERYHVPATIFVVTSLIGSDRPPPFDGWSMRHCDRVADDAWRPLNWAEIEACLATGLVDVGGHSHWHSNACHCSTDRLAEEAGRSFDILAARIGRPNDYAYPYGCSRLGQVPSLYVDAVRAAGYRQAVTYDLGHVTLHSDRFRLPRIEANGVDRAATIRAKAAGSLAPYWITDRLRQARRSA